MSPFPQFVANPSTFSVFFLDPSAQAVIQVAIVLLRILKNLEWPQMIEDKVS